MIALKSLESLSLCDSNLQVIKENCDTVASECKKGMAEKVLCTNHKGYEILVELAKKSNNQGNVQASAIKALANLLDKNPDSFDVEGFSVVVIGLDPSKGTFCKWYQGLYPATLLLGRGELYHFLFHLLEKEVIESTLDFVLSSCVLHEMNRQNLMKNGLLEKLDSVFDQNKIQGNTKVHD